MINISYYDERFLLVFMSIWALIAILSLVYTVIYLIGLYKFYEKCGKSGWISLIPIYNNWVLFELAGVEGWISLIPIVNVVYFYIVLYRLFLRFNKSTSYAVVATIFSSIFIPLVGFGNDEYQDLETEHNINYQKDMENSDDYRYCPHCGIRQTTKYCTKCGFKFK